MVDLPKMRFANRLISTLPAEAIAALAPLLEPVMLEVRQSIELLGKPISHVYFVETGMISVVAKSEGQRGTEVGMIGSEGVTGCSIALGDDRSALETFVQIPGRALRVPASDFISLLSQHPTLQNLMMRYARVLWIQATSTALANVNAKLEARLARWLLMMHDRMDGNGINITHEFLALMLHARRPGVTVALHVLEGEHLIESRRGELVVKDREGLLRFSDGTYGTPDAEYERLIGSAAT